MNLKRGDLKKGDIVGYKSEYKGIKASYHEEDMIVLGFKREYFSASDSLKKEWHTLVFCRHPQKMKRDDCYYHISFLYKKRESKIKNILDSL